MERSTSVIGTTSVTLFRLPYSVVRQAWARGLRFGRQKRQAHGSPPEVPGRYDHDTPLRWGGVGDRTLAAALLPVRPLSAASPADSFPGRKIGKQKTRRPRGSSGFALGSFEPAGELSSIGLGCNSPDDARSALAVPAGNVGGCHGTRHLAANLRLLLPVHGLHVRPEK